MKKCARCKETKGFDQFFKRPDGSTYHSYCKQCKAAVCRSSPEYRKEYWARVKDLPSVKEAARKRAKEWAEKNPERHRANNLKLQRKFPERVKGYRLKNLYNITLEQKQELAEKQGHICAIAGCGQGGLLHVDHIHGTQIVRGLLCGPCNRAIGLMKDNPERMEGAAAYLRKTGVAGKKSA